MAELVAHAPYPNSSQNKTMFSDDQLGTYDDVKFSDMFTGASLLELCNSFWMRSPSARKDVQPYLRGCKWSPDGTCCLSVVNNDGFHVMELPRDLYEGRPTTDRMITLLPGVIHVKESGLVYDFCWYPKMNSHYPETCSWISTKMNSPIQMWDAYDGSLRCSYRGFNAVDEMEPALSVTFINQGQRIVGGYKNCLRTFEVERPGREFLEHKNKSPASCFATFGSLLAVGSWNASIKLFSILDNGTYKSVGNLHAHTGGITHLQFTPDGTKLVSGARKDNNLCVWDVRYHRRPLNILKRSVSTNQRIYFDISRCGRYLISGGTDGVVRVWDNKFTKWSEQYNEKYGNQENATFRFPLYHDCCNSISIHPSRPILATGSGQLHFLDPVKVLEEECQSGINCEDVAIVQTHSMSNESSSSDEQALEEKSDFLFTKVHNTDCENDSEIQVVSENIISEVQVMDSTSELIDKNDNKDDAEVSTHKIIKLDTSCESPPAKKIKMGNATNSTTVNHIDETKSLLSIPCEVTCNITSSNLIHTHEEAPFMKSNVIAPNVFSPQESNKSEVPIKEKGLDIELKIDRIDNVSSEITKVSPLPTTKVCNLMTTSLPLDNKLKQSNISNHIKKDNTNVQTAAIVDKLDEGDTVHMKELNQSSIEESHRSFEMTTLSDSRTFDKPIPQVSEVDTESKFSEELERLSDSDISPIKMNTVKPPDRKSRMGKVLESDDDYNDLNENKMKYSSYAENNLTFWWIA